MVTIQSQNFGVEIEMTGVSRGTAASVIANYFGVGGIHFAGGTYQTYEAKDSNFSPNFRNSKKIPQQEDCGLT